MHSSKILHVNHVSVIIKKYSQYDNNLVMELTTSTEAQSDCDCSMTVEIKAQNGNCKTIVLDNVGTYDDFALGAVDVYKGDQLGNCKDFKPVDPLSIVMTHSGGDGWMGTNLNIYVGGRIYKCPMSSGQWVWKETPVQEFQCYEKIKK